MTEVSFKEMLTDSLRYWEKRRILYNAVLALVVGIYVASAWTQVRQTFRVMELLQLFVLAVLANVCYTTAYLVDLPVQYSAFRAGWLRWRWTLWTIGTLFAAAWAWFMVNGLNPSI